MISRTNSWVALRSHVRDAGFLVTGNVILETVHGITSNLVWRLLPASNNRASFLIAGDPNLWIPMDSSAGRRTGCQSPGCWAPEPVEFRAALI